MNKQYLNKTTKDYLYFSSLRVFQKRDSSQNIHFLPTINAYQTIVNPENFFERIPYIAYGKFVAIKIKLLDTVGTKILNLSYNNHRSYLTFKHTHIYNI